MCTIVYLHYLDPVVTQQKITEWEITKTEVGNKMEIFIALRKYHTRQQLRTAHGDYLVSKITPHSQ